MSRAEVADLLRAFVEDEGNPWEWDDFMSGPIAGLILKASAAVAPASRRSLLRPRRDTIAGREDSRSSKRTFWNSGRRIEATAGEASPPGHHQTSVARGRKRVKPRRCPQHCAPTTAWLRT